MENNILGNCKYEEDNWLENNYLEVITPIVKKINSSTMTYEEKIKYIYRFLVLRCSIKENYDPNIKDQYPYFVRNILGKHGIATISKYCPIVYGVGVCKGFDAAFIDIANRCYIHLEEIIGEHNGQGHGWIASIDSQGTLRHTDVYEGIRYKEQGLDIMQAFMRTTDELIRTGRYSNFYESAEKAKNNMTVISSNDNSNQKENELNFKIRR